MPFRVRAVSFPTFFAFLALITGTTTAEWRFEWLGASNTDLSNPHDIKLFPDGKYLFASDVGNNLIHRDPERPWTVAELAGAVAMSRSAFAARFTELVGEPVMRYVTRWRMYLAMEALREQGATVAQVADRLGYQSEAAFSRAFKRVTEMSPGAVRRGAADS